MQLNFLQTFQLSRILELTNIKDSLWDPFLKQCVSSGISEQHKNLLERAEKIEGESTEHCYFYDYLLKRDIRSINMTTVHSISFLYVQFIDSPGETYTQLNSPLNGFHVFRDNPFYTGVPYEELLYVRYIDTLGYPRDCFTTREEKRKILPEVPTELGKEIPNGRIHTKFRNRTKTLFKDLPEELAV